MLKANPRDIGYDLESYPNVFTAIFVHIESGTRWVFEISDRVNHSAELFAFLRHCRDCKMRMVGFNNIGYDYPMLHTFYDLCAAQGVVYANQLYAKSQQIIGSENRWANIVWPDQRIVEQIDLYLIHHFDNMARSTSLKALEINMRAHNVMDLPYDPLYPLTPEQIPLLIEYNANDVQETIAFYFHTLPAIETREALSEKFGQDFMNHNDTKIGKDFFIMELEKAVPGSCFDRSTGRKQPRQTPRPNGIPLSEVIFPYVQFRHPELQRVLNYLKTVTITNTKSAPELKDLHAVINGFRFDYGTGGIHGSISKRVVRSDETHVVIDADVTSFYPSLAIVNRVFPQHLSETFCDVYEQLFNTRKQYPKKSPENLMYKLALNGVYGDSNNQYGPFLDPKYTMTITVNGQLLLSMLSEWLISECDAEMIQANTDGITVRIPRAKRKRYDEICEWWQNYTRLGLEFAEYDGMWIRDVNNYLARTTDGKVKRVGAYQHLVPLDEEWKKQPERGWHQDHSAMIVPKAAEAVMLNGADLETFIRSHADAFNFMLRAKVPRSSRLHWGDERVQNICRYFIATDGRPLVKIMPPTAKQVQEFKLKMHDGSEKIVGGGSAPERRIGIDVGWNVRLCNVLTDWDWSKLNYEYYIREAQKLVLTSDDT